MAQCKVTSYYATRKRVHESKIVKQNFKDETVSKVSEKLKLLENQVKCEVPVKTSVSDKKIKKTTAGPASDSSELKAKNVTKKSESKTKKVKPKTTTRTGKDVKGKASAGEGNSDIRKAFETQKEKKLAVKQKNEGGLVMLEKDTKAMSDVLSNKPVDDISNEQKTDLSFKPETVSTKKIKQSKSKTNSRTAKGDVKGNTANKGNSIGKVFKAQESKTVAIKQEGDGICISKKETVEVHSNKPIIDPNMEPICMPEAILTKQTKPFEGQKKETERTTEAVVSITIGQSVEPSVSSETVLTTPKQTLNNTKCIVLPEETKHVAFPDINLCSRSPQKKQNLEDLNLLDSGSPRKKARTVQNSSKEDVVLGTSHKKLDLVAPSPIKMDRPTEQGSKVTVTNLDRAKFLNSGRLDTLKDRTLKFEKTLSALKEAESNKCKITSVISPGGQKSSQAEEKPTDTRKVTPACDRFHSLAISDAPSLTLPYKYKWLSEIFRCCDTIVSMLHNRKEICSFLKLKNSVQEMTKRKFTKSHLSQIKTVFPLAYFYSQEKFPSASIINPKPGVSQYQLVITPNVKTYREESSGKINENVMPQVENSKANKILSENNVNKQSSNEQTSTPNSSVQMNPSILVERKKIFDSNLLRIVKQYHQDFLTRLNPTITVPFEKLSRWHYKFPLDSVPDIQSSSLPEPIDVPKCHTALDVLNKIRGTVSEKVEKALQSVADKSSSSAGDKSEVDARGIIKTGSFKGISSDLLQRIRAREASKVIEEMTMPQEEKKRQQMMERLPEMVRIIRNYFISARKAAISIEDVTQKVMDSFHSGLPEEDVRAHIKLLAQVFPKWLSLVTIPKGVFLKIDKNININLMLDTIPKK